MIVSSGIWRHLFDGGVKNDPAFRLLRTRYESADAGFSAGKDAETATRKADDAADIANSDNDKPDKAAQTVKETEVGGANTEHQSQDCKHCSLGVRPPVRYKN